MSPPRVWKGKATHEVGDHQITHSPFETCTAHIIWVNQRFTHGGWRIM